MVFTQIRALHRFVRATRRALGISNFWTEQASFLQIGQPALGGHVDGVHIDPSGIIRIIGRSHSKFDTEVPSVHLDGRIIPFLQSFRFKRSDTGGPLAHAGFALDYLVPESMIGRRRILDIDLISTKLHFNGDFNFIDPHYRSLLSTPDVLHRENIYGSGPPNAVVHPDVLELARELHGPLLDFGCGQGALIRELHRRGTEACGLELDSHLIRRSIPPELASFITLYDGLFPSPFEEGQFRSVICSEVLEHIPDYESAVRDIARIARERAIFTVPDASAIPTGFRHGVIPWHLLESTHVNFFTQQSLERVLKPWFSKINFRRIGRCHVNDSEFFVSLVADCSK